MIDRMARLLSLREQGLQYDEEDLPLLLNYTWRISDKGYAVATSLYVGEPRTIGMSRVLMGKPPPEMEIDHEDRNPLNNRRSNLRFVTSSINRLNQDRVDAAAHVSEVHGRYFLQVQRMNVVFSKRYRTRDEAVAAGEAFIYAYRAFTGNSL